MNKKLIVILSAAFMVLAFVLSMLFFQKKEVEQVTKEVEKVTSNAAGNTPPFVRPYSPTEGSHNAKVTIVEFLDPACETCSAFHPFIKKIMQQFEGKLRHVVRYAAFHEGADYAVKVLEASRNQNLYWETLELMFKTLPQWTHHHQVKPEQLLAVLEQSSLDLDRLKADMENPEILQNLNQDMADVKALNVQKTPGFFVNGKPLVRFGYGTLRNLITAEVDANYAAY